MAVLGGGALSYERGIPVVGAFVGHVSQHGERVGAHTLSLISTKVSVNYFWATKISTRLGLTGSSKAFV